MLGFFVYMQKHKERGRNMLIDATNFAVNNKMLVGYLYLIFCLKLCVNFTTIVDYSYYKWLYSRFLEIV